MASRSSSRAPVGTPPVADNAHPAVQPPLNNPAFVAKPATEIVDHLKHRRTDDFADTEHEQRLVEAKQRVRVEEKRIGRPLEGIKAGDAQIQQAAMMEVKLDETGTLLQPAAADAKARPLQQSRATNAKARARHGSGPSGHGLTQPAVRASKRVRYDSMPAARGEVGGHVPKTKHRALRMNASTEFPSSDDESEGFDTGGNTTSDQGDVPKHKSLRMNASTGFPGRRSVRLPKQPRRRS